MKAVILAGGKGTRLAPYTTVLPKPLMPIGGVPILEIILWQLKHFRIEDVTLACGHMAELIQAYLMRNRISRELNLSYYTESKPYGTAGALREIPGLDDTFLVMNGDLLTAIDYSKLIRYHRECKAALTIAVTRKVVKVEMGVLRLAGDNTVVGYDEKPVMEFPASTGIYVYEPRVLDYMQHQTYLDLPSLVLRLIEAGEKVAGHVTDEFWLDIGNKDDFERASRELIKHRADLHAEQCFAGVGEDQV
jgi:NDP-mannose synthase